MADTTVGMPGILVNIVSQVAGNTLLRQWLIDFICPVTALALNFRMTTLQFKITVFFMFEYRFFPVHRLVTLLTVLAIVSLMLIVYLVTGIAARWNVFVALVGMAQDTINCLVCACEDVVCIFRMIETGGLPVGCLVTYATIFSEPPQVAIISLVTAKAC